MISRSNLSLFFLGTLVIILLSHEILTNHLIIYGAIASLNFSILFFILILDSKKNNFLYKNVFIFFFYMFCIWTLYVFLLSIFIKINFNKNYSNSILLLALIKTSVMPTLAFLFYIFIDNNKKFLLILRIFIYFLFIAGLIQYLQYFIKPLDIFTKYSIRHFFDYDLFRFGSPLGSITIPGVAYPYGFLICIYAFEKKYLKIFFSFTFIIFSILTIQKTGLINLFMVLSFISIYFIHGLFKKLSNLKKIYKILIYISLIIIFSYVLVIVLNEFNLSLWNDLKIRLFQSFFKLINEFGLLSLIFGSGYQGFGSSIGITGGQAHNSLFDLFLVGGIIYPLIALSLIFICIYLNLIPRNNVVLDKDKRFFNISIILFFLLNMPSTSLAFFHPFTSIPFWLVLAYTFNQNAR